MYIKWLDEHVSEVADALRSRMFREGMPRRWQMIFCPSVPGTRGGIAVIPEDDAIPQGWQPINGVMADAANMTRDQMYYHLCEATKRLPVLDPNEP